MWRHAMAIVVLLMLIVASATASTPQRGRVLSPGTMPDDQRLGDLRDLDSYFPFKPVADAAAWEKRAQELRRRTMLANGIWPMPSRSPLNAVVHGKVWREDYTVEKVYFESMPGHFVTGSLYRPVGFDGKRPAMLCPHGHWSNARFFDKGLQAVREEIAIGAERFEDGGRNHIQARCVQLARMGLVVFHYDMIGYSDSVQLEHRPGVREHMNTMKDFGFFSPQAELRQLNMMGLQTWNSVRALDFVLSLPEVDATRVGVTGASGGGTQTLMLAAVDDRIALSFPAVMTSTAMQGGCSSENACYLRIDSGNIDIAALAAPRPLGVTSADDWTIELETKGMPDLKDLYKMLGKPDFVQGFFHTNFKHNYNHVSRTDMYNFVNRHFKLGYPQPVLERDYTPLTHEETTVWDEKKHKRPSGDQVGDAHERRLVAWWKADNEKQIGALTPQNKQGLSEYRRIVGGAWETMIGRTLADVGVIEYQQVSKAEMGHFLFIAGTLTSRERGEQVPAIFLHPAEKWSGDVVIWIGENGKADLLNADDTPIPAVDNLIRSGYSVMSVDTLYQGEFLADGKPLESARVNTSRRGRAATQPWHTAACYTYGYNHPLFCQRVHDVLTAIEFVRTDQHGARRIHLVGLGATAGPIIAAARSVSGDAVERTAIDTRGFRFQSLNRLDDPMFVPGAVKYGDVPALLGLCAPAKLLVAGEGDKAAPITGAVYQAAGAAANLKTFDGKPAAVVNWLTQ